jgi:O-antigen/teichoic acid export membrane protein
MLVFGLQYIQAYTPSIYLIWSFVFLFFSYISLDFFTALDKQIFNLQFAFLVVILSIILLLFFIPLYSFNAAGGVKLTVSLIGAGFVLFHLKKIKLKIYFFDKNILSWIVICSILIYIISYLPLYLYVLIAPIIIFIITVRAHVFQEEELYILLQKFNKEHWAEKISKW